MASSKRKRKSSTSARTSHPAGTTEVPELEAEDTSAGLSTEYAYVRKDLRHLAIVSVVLFVVMLGVGYFI